MHIFSLIKIPIVVLLLSSNLSSANNLEFYFTFSITSKFDIENGKVNEEQLDILRKYTETGKLILTRSAREGQYGEFLIVFDDLINRCSNPKIIESKLINLSNAGVRSASVTHGYALYKGECLTRDIDRSISIFESLAAKNEVLAQEFLGRIYFYNDTLLNINKSKQFSTMAVKNDSRIGSFVLGMIKQKFPNSKIQVEFEDLMKHSALLNFAPAQYNLYILYKDSDPQEAIKWLKRSVDNKFKDAIISYAMILYRENKPNNKLKIVNLLKNLDLTGNLNASTLLGIAMLSLNTKADREQGLILLETNAEQGNVPSIKYLSSFYKNMHMSGAGNQYKSKLLVLCEKYNGQNNLPNCNDI